MKITAIKVYQVDLPLREGRYNWSGGNFMEVFDSTVVAVETDAGIHVVEVAVQDVSRAEAVGKREAELEERIQKLKDEKAALEVDDLRFQSR